MPEMTIEIRYESEDDEPLWSVSVYAHRDLGDELMFTTNRKSYNAACIRAAVWLMEHVAEGEEE